MKRLFALLLLAALSVLQAPAHAQARYYNQAELDALLAPVALYPDPLLSQVLIAATYPGEVREAAAWLRANPQLSGDDALRAAEATPWPPSVKAMLAYPELLARMHESPQWTADLGAAFLAQEPQVMDTVQALRRRAQASGALQSNEQQSVYQQGQTLIVQPAQPQIVYVPYYDPYVVYGPWWWYSYRPVAWRPWYPRPAAVSANFRGGSVDWHRHRVTPAPRQIVSVHNHVQQAQIASRMQERRLQQSRPIIQSAPVQVARPTHRVEQRREPRMEQRQVPRTEQRQLQRQEQRPQHRNGRG
jgi:hypothetical protein